VGLLFHFWLVLVRFVRRSTAAPTKIVHGGGRSAEADDAANVEASQTPSGLSWAVTGIVVLLAAAMFLSKARQPEVDEGEMDLAAFGQLPVAYQGRVKPLDTLARNTLRIISDRETFEDADGNRQPAIRWLADMVANPEVGHLHKVFRIRFDQLLHTLDREPLRAGGVPRQAPGPGRRRCRGPPQGRGGNGPL